MPVDARSRLSNAASMRITAALSEVWPKAMTQQAIAAHLTSHGLPTDQTKVSAWLRGRVPNLEQLVMIEEAFSKPRGWVLTQAGFVDPAAVLKALDGVVVPLRGRTTEPRSGARAASSTDPKKPLPKRSSRERSANRPSPEPEPERP